ncbi:flagella basal body P-ring formation protein FlgA [Sandarakinorhabdus sp.]|uniref:flagella basal body P-ring formation protein FlgA n=1 Tax=Sandarakinorhabdus sp. TaxID=1916663 RepID=UPI003F6F0E9E
MRARFKRMDVKFAHVAIGATGLVVLLFAGRAHAQGIPALHDVPALRTSVERFAGAAARLDPRLVVPRCPSPALSWARADVVRADCADPVWTLYVPVAVAMAAATQAPARTKPAIRRGERVLVEASGPGFAISMEAEAERDADGTRIALKGPAGRRFTGRIADDGRVVLAR